MPAGRADFVIEQGATWQRVITWLDDDGNPVNLTNATARMQVRQDKKSTAVLIELSTADGRITMGGALGTITLTLDATTTAALNWTRKAVYDLEVVSGANVARLLQGCITLSKEVTR